MIVLELFAGTRSIGRAFERAGHTVYSVEWDRKFEDIALYADIGTLTAQDCIELCGGRRPDIVWASPDCTSYSVAGIGHHRMLDKATGRLLPKTDYGRFCDKVNAHVVELIRELSPKYWFIENPVGGMRKMEFMDGLPRYTTTYCFAKETGIITSEGVKEIGTLAGKNVTLLTSEGWKSAPIREYGEQRLMELTLSRLGKIKTVFCTPEHKWILKTGGLRSTTELKKGQRLKYVCTPKMEHLDIIPEYVARGFAFGDGYILKNKPKSKGYAMFCFDKKAMMPYFKDFCGKPYMHNVKKYGDNVMKLYGYPREWKTELPASDWSPSEKYSWVAGYFAADGYVGMNKQISLSSSKLENLITVRDRCREIGIDTCSVVTSIRKGYGIEPTPLYQVSFMRSALTEEFFLRPKHKSRFKSFNTPVHQTRCWSVVSVKETERIEPVYCADVPDIHNFALDDGLLTHNCQWGDTRQKPTDIWTNHPSPNFKAPCKRGSPCHEAAPRGTRCGTQRLKGSVERARIPDELCEHIVRICSEAVLTVEKPRIK